MTIFRRARRDYEARASRKSRISRYLAAFQDYKAQLENADDWRLGVSEIHGGRDRSIPAREYFSHYDVFCYYACQRIRESEPFETQVKIFDVGSCKSFLAMLAVSCDVHALNLSDPLDILTGVKWVVSDIADFNAKSYPGAGTFDFVTSTVAFHLLGIGRYGDKVDCRAQSLFVELCRTLLRPGGKVVLSASLGKDQLDFNNGWVFSLPSLRKYFNGFAARNILVDTNAYGDVDPARDPGTRFRTLPDDGDLDRETYRGFDGTNIPNDVVFITFEKVGRIPEPTDHNE